MVAADVLTKLDVELKRNPARTVIRLFGSGYAIGDEYFAFATGSVDDLLSMMEWFK